jgi:hypothetical protein
MEKEWTVILVKPQQRRVGELIFKLRGEYRVFPYSTLEPSGPKGERPSLICFQMERILDKWISSKPSPAGTLDHFGVELNFLFLGFH